MPFAKLRVVRTLPGHGVLHDLVAEIVDHCCDREHATKALVQTLFCHVAPPAPCLPSSLSSSLVDEATGVYGCGYVAREAVWIRA